MYFYRIDINPIKNISSKEIMCSWILEAYMFKWHWKWSITLIIGFEITKTSLTLLVNLTSVVPLPCGALGSCLLCLMHKTALEICISIFRTIKKLKFPTTKMSKNHFWLVPKQVFPPFELYSLVHCTPGLAFLDLISSKDVKLCWQRVQYFHPQQKARKLFYFSGRVNFPRNKIKMIKISNSQ